MDSIAQIKLNPIPEKTSKQILDKLKDEKYVILFSVILLVSGTIGLSFFKELTFMHVIVILGGFSLILSIAIVLKKTPKEKNDGFPEKNKIKNNKNGK